MLLWCPISDTTVPVDMAATDPCYDNANAPDHVFVGPQAAASCKTACEVDWPDGHEFKHALQHAVAQAEAAGVVEFDAVVRGDGHSGNCAVDESIVDLFAALATVGEGACGE